MSGPATILRPHIIIRQKCSYYKCNAKAVVGISVHDEGNVFKIESPFLGSRA